jgi:hypothetical protein
MIFSYNFALEIPGSRWPVDRSNEAYKYDAAIGIRSATVIALEERRDENDGDGWLSNNEYEQ